MALESRHFDTNAPVSPAPNDKRRAVQPGWALCLSGGGFRAMVFHLGVLWRLNDAGILSKLDRISSVSGGSITAGMLGLKWDKLVFDAEGVASNLLEEVIRPLRRLGGQTVDVPAIVAGLLLPWTSIGRRVEAAYRRHLFGTATLQSLPVRPRFVINATSLQSGVLWRFMRPYMRDYRVGQVPAPTVSLARAVAASSAFPPFLSPVRLDFAEGEVIAGNNAELGHKPYTRRALLTDGGVYDNLGLETAWKRYETILVSDAGARMEPAPRPWRLWSAQAFRVLNVIDSQVRSLRKRQLIEAYEAKRRMGAYWGIRTNIADYELADVLPCPHERTVKLAEIPTRLKKLPADLQERLINWGYAVCDAALRKHLDPPPALPKDFPFPLRGV
ncbi:MAG: patatin-like phospholipase family protein [Pirellulales bacterium]